jgi:hypothetical protein
VQQAGQPACGLSGVYHVGLCRQHWPAAAAAAAEHEAGWLCDLCVCACVQQANYALGYLSRRWCNATPGCGGTQSLKGCWWFSLGSGLSRHTSQWGALCLAGPVTGLSASTAWRLGLRPLMVLAQQLQHLPACCPAGSLAPGGTRSTLAPSRSTLELCLCLGWLIISCAAAAAVYVRWVHFKRVGRRYPCLVEAGLVDVTLVNCLCVHAVTC